MKPFPIIAIAAMFLASAAQAVPGGKLTVLEKGGWTCEIPGDANTLATEKPELGFLTIADSSYVAPDGSTGTYLRLADRLTLTSGIFSGRRFVMDGEEILREVTQDDTPTGIRCVRAGPVRIATPG